MDKPLFGRVLDHLMSAQSPVLAARLIVDEVRTEINPPATLEDREAALSTMQCRKCNEPLSWRAKQAAWRQGTIHTAWCCDIFYYTNAFKEP